MAKHPNRKLILEDGRQYYGFGFGDTRDKILEIVFNTSMAGYQEILSDPSYTDQAVVMTYPLIGNYGMADDDYETEVPTIGAMIVHDYNDEPSNFRSTSTLCDVMKKYGIAGVSGVDTRKLNRSIRDHGSCLVLITGMETSLEDGLARLRSYQPPSDAVSRVSCKKIWTSPAMSGSDKDSEIPEDHHHVVLIDCGMKRNILRSLNHRGCDVTVVPWNTAASDILALHPDGIMISNGPGDPTDVPQTISTVKSLIGACPIFGICLGHQILSLAYGASTYKLKFGHRGANHPVRNLTNNKIEITSQNHSYAVDNNSLKDTPLSATHINILDNTIEGVACARDNAFSVQYHPESAPGPQDSAYLFDQFIGLMDSSHRNSPANETTAPAKEVFHA